MAKPCCICLEQNSTRKRRQDFEASGFRCWILHNNHFFLKRSQKSKKKKKKKKNQNVKESRDTSKQKVPFYDQDYACQASKL